MNNQRIENLTVLVVVRSDYVGMLHGLCRKEGLPPMRQTDNWKEISPFSEQDARNFLNDSGLSIGRTLMDDLFRQIAEIEGTEGLVRPISLNMIGVILARTAMSEQRSLPKQRESGGLIFAYLSPMH